VVDAAEAVDSVGQIEVVTNQLHHPAMVAWASSRGRRKPLRLWNNGARSLGERRGAIGDLAFLVERMRPRAPVLVLAADNVFDFSLEPLAEHAAREPVVALRDVGTRERVRALASVAIDDGGRVTAFVEKDPDPPGTLACLALYGLPVDALPEVPRYLGQGGHPDNLGFFIEWLHRRRPVRGLVMGGRWVDVGSPADYRQAQEWFGTTSPSAPG
jgi:glucose-1-phosphate thymidylyltransferase